MTVGMILGGVLGGAIGWMIGGPAGAYYGFTIGFGVGAMVDPLIPDMPVPGMPELGNLNISTAEEGLPIKDVLGTTKISSGNIFWYGAQRVVEITEEVETGGKGGGGTENVVTGYNYYVSWALGICMGPVDTLYTVYNGDDVVWSGELNRPLAGGEETIVLTDMGSMTFYFGTADQVANVTLTSKLEDPTLSPAYRHQCYAFFNDCCTGTHERIPTMKFVLRKNPTFAFNASETIQTYDYNPAHAMYYILNTLLDIPTTYLDPTDFSDVADTLYTENRGISMLFDAYSPALTYLGESLLAHIDGLLRWGNDGKFHPKLIRADEAVGALPSFDENDMLSTLQLSRKSWYDTKNEVKVEYAERIYPGFEAVAGIVTVIDSWEWDSDVLYILHASVKIPAAWEGEILSGYVAPFTTYWAVGMFAMSWAKIIRIDTFQIASETGLITKVLTDQRKTFLSYEALGSCQDYLKRSFFPGAYYFRSNNQIDSIMIYPAGNIGIEPAGHMADFGIIEYPCKAITLTGLGTLCCTVSSNVGTASKLNTFQVNAVAGFGTDVFMDSHSFIYTGDTSNFDLIQTHMVGMIACIYTTGTNVNGYIFTIGVDIAGDIEDSEYDSYQFENTTCYRPKIIWLQGTDTDSIYVLVYDNGANYTIKTLSIDNSGNISELSSNTGTCTSLTTWANFDICKVDKETIAVVGRDGLYGGRIYLYQISNSGAISELGTLKFYDGTIGGKAPEDFRIIYLGNNFYLISYMIYYGLTERHGHCTTIKIV